MGSAVFRCDATPATGGGHAMRCLALAEALRDSGWSATFAGVRETLGTVPAIGRSGFAWIELSGAPQEEPAALAAAVAGGCDVLVVDHYGRGGEFESACRGFAARIAVIEDIPGRVHDADFLLDATPGRETGDYAGLVPGGCRLLVGPHYAPLRRRFSESRNMALARRERGKGIARLLVSLGATDPGNVTSVVLRGIAKSGLTAPVDVVMGQASPHLSDVRALAASLGINAKVHVDVSDMATLMAAADVAVGAAGSTSFERCCLGLPSLVVVVADNQKQIAAALVAAGAAVSLGEKAALRDDDVAAALGDLAADAEKRAGLSRRGAVLCDGRGATRTAITLAPERAGDGREVTLRPVTPADGPLMLEWQRHPTTRRYARNPAVPGEAEHAAWLQARLGDPATLFNIVLHGAEPAGVLRLDRMAWKGVANYEVSVLVDPGRRALGLGKAALRLALRLAPEAELFAEVHPDNTASHSLFQSAGFQRTDGTYRHDPLLREVPV